MRRLRPDDVEQLLEARARGLTVRPLAEMFGIHPRAAFNHLRRAEVPRRAEWDDETTAEAVRRYQAGESLAAIAAHLGRSATTVNAHLRQAGVQIRPRGGGGDYLIARGSDNWSNW